jgi:xylulokinase
MNRLLALDIGTQSARAAVVSEAGSILGIAQKKHDVDSPKPGWAQQRPDDWWKETCGAIRDVLEQTGVAPGSIAAVACCGQMHGPVGIDSKGQVTTEWVQLWCDKRCDSQVETLCENHDASRLASIAGSYPNPAWSGIKVRWHKDNQPEVYQQTEWFLVPKDFINYRLTGVAAGDPSEASGSFLWDCQKDTYSRELADAVGVDLEKFAPIHASHRVIGNVTAAASGLTGIPAGVPVVAGGGDFPVSMLGFGIVGDGVTADVTGTSMLLATHSKKPLLDAAIQNLRHAVDGWIPFTILDCGGISMKWCKDLVDAITGRDVPYEELIEMATQAPAGSDGLLFYPYMLGERRSENTKARGGYFGISLHHSAPHFVRSVMEGVALATGKDVTQFRKLGHDITRIFSVGGGTRNKLWNQIKADVFQVPLELSDEPEAGLKGAALLAAAGVGWIDDPAATAVERRTSNTTVQPDDKAGVVYGRTQEEFSRVYEHMLGFWKDS